jgi:hypothetical protein
VGLRGDLFYINLITQRPLGGGKGGGVLTEISMVLAFMYNDSLSRIPIENIPLSFFKGRGLGGQINKAIFKRSDHRG